MFIDTSGMHPVRDATSSCASSVKYRELAMRVISLSPAQTDAIDLDRVVRVKEKSPNIFTIYLDGISAVELVGAADKFMSLWSSWKSGTDIGRVLLEDFWKSTQQ